MSAEKFPHAADIPVILKGFPSDLNEKWIYHEFENYAIGGQVRFEGDHGYLAGSWVFSADKEFLDNLEYLVINWDENIRNSLI